MLIAFLLVLAGAAVLWAYDYPWGLFLIVAGAILWIAVVLYRMLTATAED